MTTYPTKNSVDAAPALEFPEKKITLSTVIAYRGRQITVTVEGYTLDQLCDMLDKRAPVGKEHAAPERPGQVSDTATVPPTCPVHRKVMKLMKFADKQGHTHMCTFRYDDGSYCDERA